MSGFEGSYLGKNDQISPRAIMECKICWTPYDPAVGDETRQILPGTPFLALPDDWKCPNCDAPKEQFLVNDDPGSHTRAEAEAIAARTALLEAEFIEIWHAKMRDVPIVNKLLRVEAVGFRMHEGRPLGVLVSPWFMNLILLPAEGEDWSALVPGANEVVVYPSGEYMFIHNARGALGGYKACSLFSPMGEFRSQAQAVDVAEAVMVALFNEENRADTDRSADIRAAREADLDAAAALEAEADATLEADAAAMPAAPSRRQVISAGLSAEG